MAEQVNIYLGAGAMLTSLGDAAKTYEAMAEGRCGLRYDDSLGMVAGRVGDVAEEGDVTRFEALMVHNLKQVCSISGVSLSQEDTRLVISTTKGNVSLLTGEGAIDERCYLWSSARRVATYFGAAHEPVVISNACISGVSAFVVARRMILKGQCRNVIVVGCDCLSEFIAEGFASFKSVSSRACRPYDAERDGLSLGEAAAAVLLTADRRKAVEPAVVVAGGAITNDANHISGPSRTGDGLYYAMAGALGEAQLQSVGMINLHGTATAYNDEMESKAVAWAELLHVPTNSLKGYIGHCLGAAGVVETLLAAEQIRRGEALPTCGFERLGVPHELNITTHLTPLSHPSCLKTASGFGGCNAAIVLRAEEVGSESREDGEGSVSSESREWRPQREVEQTAEYRLPQAQLPFAEFIRQQYKDLGQANMKFYKMSDMCKAAYVAAERLLAQSGFEAPAVRRAVVLANSASSLDADRVHQHIIEQHNAEGASPAAFVYTLPNVAAGELCIRHKIQGENTFFVEREPKQSVEQYACDLVACGVADEVICGWCDKLGEQWSVELKMLKTKKI